MKYYIVFMASTLGIPISHKGVVIETENKISDEKGICELSDTLCKSTMGESVVILNIIPLPI